MKREDIDERLSKLQRLWEGGLVPALFETVVWCHDCQVPLPDWASLPILNLIIDLYNAPNSTKTEGGGYASHYGRTKMDYAHYLRWRAVSNQLWTHKLNTLPAVRGRPRAKDPRLTKKQILEDALNALRRGRRKQSRTRDDTASLEASYRLVQKSRGSGDGRFMFEDLWLL